VALALFGVVFAVLLSMATRLTPHVRDAATSALDERFQSDVELDALQVSVFPRPEVSGAGLRLRHNGRTDVPPLIAIGSYSASAGLLGLLRSPLRLRTVELDRLEITIPPGGLHDKRRDERPRGNGGDEGPGISIERIVSREARLEIVPRDRAKLPRVFEIHDLVMVGLGDAGGATFNASLTNPLPRGEITTEGTFGPWRKAEPGTTPVRGNYLFKNADLNTIKGIAGKLSSSGSYSGVLERIDVKGETDTPDFAVDVAGQPVPLKTRFHAIVDGTNGNTWLEQVESHVYETTIVAKGAVVRAEDVKGRRITLDVTIDDGRIEDVLKLAVKAKDALMTGRMTLKTKFLLPAGDRDVIDKLELEGAFALEEARFTKVNVQQRLNELSRRARGKTGGDGPSVVSNLSGRFVLQDATLKFTDLRFAVPGAVVQLAGSMDLRSEALNFAGHLLLDASLSETTTGIKSVLAAIAQPLFKREGGGSKLPIKVFGTTSKPAFGLDVKRVLTPGS
jgi:hypothetical protein